jgi:2-oxo-hept-3-ene-1,7-dioate hydratase
LFDEALIDTLAGELEHAEAQRAQLTQFSLRFPEMSIDDGYRVGRAWVARKASRGRVVCGRKIGLTSHAMQAAAGITEPDYGTLLDDMFFANGSDIPFERFIEPQVEVELAFRLNEEIDANEATVPDVVRATESVIPAVEIIDARIQRVDIDSQSRRKVQDTIADNAACAGVVLGDQSADPGDLDLRWVAAILSKNGEVVETGVAAGVLNHPANGLIWLARKLVPWGERLKAGDVVLSGSFIRPVEARPGDSFRADYGPLGALSFRFQ